MRLPTGPARSRLARRTGALALLTAVAVSPSWLAAQQAASACIAGSVGISGAPGAADTTRDGGGELDATRALARHAGARIAAIDIVTRGPDVSRLVPTGALHVTTREATVRDALLFSVGDTLDPRRVAESLRRLRRLRAISGAAVEARCANDGGVALTIVTRDAWSLRARIRAGRGAGTTVGLEETNLMGTGRGARIYARSEAGRNAVGIAYSDPALLGLPIRADVHRDAFVGGTAWGAVLRTREAGALARGGVTFGVRRTTRVPAGGSSGLVGDSIRRSDVAALFARRLREPGRAATFLLGGVEASRTELVAGSGTPLLGPSSVRRAFVGIDAGLARRSAVHVTAPWLVPAAGATGVRDARYAESPAEIPAGLEFDGIAALGRDVANGSPMTHVDLWAGRTWAPRPSASGVPAALVTADVWLGGYRAFGAGGGRPLAGAEAGAREWSAGTARAALGAVLPARGGLWTLRTTAERLADPDPDTRGLADADPALARAPGRGRLAEAAFSLSLDRSFHLRPVTRGYVLDAVPFARAGMRWDPAMSRSALAQSALGTTPGLPGRMGASSLGVGLQLVPTRFGRASMRIDVGMPVLRTAGVGARPFVALSITPAFGTGRGRAGAAAAPTP